MIIGEEKIRETTEKLIEIISSNESDLVEIEEVMILVVVHYGSDPEEGTESGSLFYRCTTGRYHIQRGILAHAERAVEYNTRLRE